MGHIFSSVPVGSLSRLSKTQRDNYIDQVVSLPTNVRKMMFSPATGAFIRGVAKAYNLPLEQSPEIAFAALQVALGDKPLSRLAHDLAIKLNIAVDTADKVAREIEKELFAPIALEFNQHLKSKRPSSSPALPPANNLPNVLDLKNQPPKPPLPPPIPKK